MQGTRVKHSGRGAPRFITGLPADVLGSGAILPGETTNLSRSGALLRAAVGECLARPVRVRLTSARGDLRVELPSRVTRIVPIDSTSAAEIGVVFSAVPREVRERFESLLARVREASDSGALAAVPHDAKPEVVRGVLDKMSTMHRVRVAARAAAPERRWLHGDRDPRVQEALVRNPSVGAEEVLSIARAATVSPSVLETIVLDSRWTSREELMIVIASHPRATLRQAETACARLGAPARTRLLRRPYLHPTLRTRLLKGTFP